ncbi:LysE family translocator [Amycolatopsis sp.]|uniref:LysE family translocator n=1 Tax=Amycolatopsis sp. TaxID=37632 RepID=UPI002D0F1610|nr:LysE family translocator [Amycolatopsis sp.]HVV12237.1 LysE family translocator [Amycolatopsis sp.]
MATGSIPAFWVVALLLIAVPGADWAFTVSAGLRGRSVLPAVGGLMLGYTAISAVVAAGVGAALARTPAILTGLTLAGGVYLLWHGGWTAARPSTPDTPGAQSGTGGRILLRGFGVSTLNVKGLLVFLALLPQFTDPRANWPVAAQLGVLGLVFVLTCGAFYWLLGTFARGILRSRPVAARAVSRVSGMAMVVIGLLVIVARLAQSTR